MGSLRYPTNEYIYIYILCVCGDVAGMQLNENLKFVKTIKASLYMNSRVNKRISKRVGKAPFIFSLVVNSEHASFI